MTRQDSVAGFHSSAVSTGMPALALLNPGPRVPPTASTFPSGSMTAFSDRRAALIDPTARHVGLGVFRSITSAVLVGGSPPPTIRILPGSYITALP